MCSLFFKWTANLSLNFKPQAVQKENHTGANASGTVLPDLATISIGNCLISHIYELQVQHSKSKNLIRRAEVSFWRTTKATATAVLPELLLSVPIFPSSFNTTVFGVFGNLKPEIRKLQTPQQQQQGKSKSFYKIKCRISRFLHSVPTTKISVVAKNWETG